MEELKQMVSEIVMSVLSDNTNRRITIQDATSQVEEKEKKEPKKRERKPTTPKESKPRNEVKRENKTLINAEKTPASASILAVDLIVGQPCPLCGKGTIIKGKTAYGCSEWRSGCTYRKAFES